MEVLKTGSIEKETRINHFKGKFQGRTSSLENAKKDVITTYMKLDDFTSRLDQNYDTGYKSFRFDAKEAYPGMDFDSFKVPTAAKTPCFRRALRMLISWTML